MKGVARFTPTGKSRTEMRLTEKQLDLIEQHTNAATEGIELHLKCTGEIVECGVGGRFAPTEHDVELFVHAKHYMTELVTELRSLRALLETPMPSGWAEPRVVVMRGHGAEDMVQCEWLGAKPVFHEEAAALGASLIRAALSAREGEK